MRIRPVLRTLCAGVIIYSCLIAQQSLAQNKLLKNNLPAVFPKLFKSFKSEKAVKSVSGTPLYQRDIHADTAAFTLYPADLTGVMAGDAVWVDYDGDGDLDILVSGWDDAEFISKIYRNDNGVFTDIQANIIGLGTEKGVSWGDYDNDGDYDLAISGGLSISEPLPVTRIYRNDNGSFVDIQAPLMQLTGGSATWIDYNCDGKLDFLVTGSPDAGRTFFTKLYRNDDTAFNDSYIQLPGVWGSSVAWGDYDNDGYPDLLISGFGSTAITNLYHYTDSSKSFTQVDVPFQPVNACGVAWGDYDNDGLLDIIISGDPPGWDGTNTFTTIYRNLGSGQFQDIHPNLPQLNLTAVAWGDYDNDGDLDLAISGWLDNGTNVTKIFRNDGNGVFTDIHADLPPVWWGSLAWGDADNDGKLDLLMTGATTPHLYASSDPPYHPVTLIFHNNTGNQGVHPSVPGNPVASVSGNSVTFGWNKSTDSKTPQRALTYNIRVGTLPGDGDIVSPSSNPSGYRRVPQHGNRYLKSTYSLDHLPVGTYYWTVQAVNNAFVGSNFASELKFDVLPPYLWHLVSLPYTYPNTNINFLFPSARSPAFFYRATGGYGVDENLTTGIGYWVRFPATSPPVFSTGGSLPSISIPVSEGWNLIGSVDHSIPVPVNPIISSHFYRFSQGYQVTSTIDPGEGYWVKVASAGTLALGVPSAIMKTVENELSNFDNLIVTDGNNSTQTLYYCELSDTRVKPEKYELPPVGPDGVFDARFANNRMLATSEEGKTITIPLRISTDSYPVKISWNSIHPLTASLVIDGKATRLQSRGSVKISSPGTHISLVMGAVKSVPRAYALEQNYPNPFNPSTVISYSLPVRLFVRLTVYNLLGSEVRTLQNGYQDAGYKSVTFDAKDLPSGIYFYQLQAGKFTETKKTILLK